MHAWFFNNDTSLLTDDWVDSNALDPKFSETPQFLADLILVHKFSPNPAGWDETAHLHAGNLVMRTCGRWCFGASLAEGFETYDIQYQPYQSVRIARTSAPTAGASRLRLRTIRRRGSRQVPVQPGCGDRYGAVGRQRAGPTPASEMPVFAEYGLANTALLYKSLDYAKTVPSPTNFNIIEPVMNRHLETIWNGEKTVDEAVQAMHVELQAEMDKIKA